MVLKDKSSFVAKTSKLPDLNISTSEEKIKTNGVRVRESVLLE